MNISEFHLIILKRKELCMLSDIKQLRKILIVVEVLFFTAALAPLTIGQFDLVHALLVVFFIAHTAIASAIISHSLKSMLNQETRLNDLAFKFIEHTKTSNTEEEQSSGTQA